MTGKIQTVSYSELIAGRQCPFKHQLLYKERWTKDPKAGGALDRGILWHSVLEEWYRSLAVTQRSDLMADQTFRKDLAYQAGIRVLDNAYDTGRDRDTTKLVRWMFNGYVDRYELDDEWAIIAVEHKGVVPLYEASGRKSRFRLKVKIDLVAKSRSSGRLWIVDHKSHANIPSQKDYDLDIQFPLYVLSLQRLGHPVFGTIYNTARTTINQGDLFNPGDPGYKTTMRKQSLDERFDRHKMNHPANKLLAVERDTLASFKALYSTTNKGERHTDPDHCRRRCDMAEACMLGLSTGDDRRTRLMLSETGWQNEQTRH